MEKIFRIINGPSVGRVLSRLVRSITSIVSVLICYLAALCAGRVTPRSTGGSCNGHCYSGELVFTILFKHLCGSLDQEFTPDDVLSANY